MDNRVQREKELYNTGFEAERLKYDSKFGHANEKVGYYSDYLKELRQNIMQKAKGKKVLELGSSSWASFIDLAGFPPSDITCINISESELEIGVELYKNLELPQLPNFNFMVMDANKLEFEDESFDVVFGAGILHHLDFDKAVQEIKRVLKKDGFCFFIEPMGSNPIGRIVRKRTPQARTIDEKPLENHEISLLKKHFKTRFTFSQLFYVPAGVISVRLFKNPYNLLMKAAFIIDKLLAKIMPLRFNLLYRFVHVYAEKP